MLLVRCACCAEARPSRLRHPLLVMIVVAGYGGVVVAGRWVDCQAKKLWKARPERHDKRTREQAEVKTTAIASVQMILN